MLVFIYWSLTTLGIEVYLAFALSLPLGIFGFIYCFLSFKNSIKEVVKQRNYTFSNAIALICSSIPFLVLAFGLFIATHRGGV